MDGSILPIAFGAFTVLYIAGWFCTETLSCRPGAVRARDRSPATWADSTLSSERPIDILTRHFINGPGAHTRTATTFSPPAAGSVRNRANYPTAGDTRRAIPRW